MIDVSRLKQLLAERQPVRTGASRISARLPVEEVHRWHDQTFAMIREVLDRAGIPYSIPAVKIALRGDMPGLNCGQEVTIESLDGRRLVIASVGPNVIHVEALPMIRIVLREDGRALLEDDRAGDALTPEQFNSASFVALLERWAANDL